MRKRAEAADVVRVQVREHDPPHRAGSIRARAARRLVFGRELESRQPQERVPAWVVAGARGARRLAGVEEATPSGWSTAKAFTGSVSSLQPPGR